MKKKKKHKFLPIERILYSLLFMFLLVATFGTVWVTSKLSQVNFEVEKQKSAIVTQTKKNESLKMKINELVSLEKIQEIAKLEGLSYNNNNIKLINK